MTDKRKWLAVWIGSLVLNNFWSKLINTGTHLNDKTCFTSGYLASKWPLINKFIQFKTNFMPLNIANMLAAGGVTKPCREKPLSTITSWVQRRVTWLRWYWPWPSKCPYALFWLITIWSYIKGFVTENSSHDYPRSRSPGSYDTSLDMPHIVAGCLLKGVHFL